jgi:predicted RNA-binding Zn ribbon-like protein
MFMDSSPFATTEPQVIADHSALDLMNTVAIVDGKLVDFFQTDSDVVRWLIRTGFADRPTVPQSGLLEAAKALRETIRALVTQRKNGVQADPTALNGFLAEARSYSQLVWDEGETPQVERRWEQHTPGQLLAPLAEAGAELLSAVDFDLVRSCGNPECVRWFYDRTKSHRRRWCSMAVCGNRHKVAAFRRRRIE